MSTSLVQLLTVFCGVEYITGMCSAESLYTAELSTFVLLHYCCVVLLTALSSVRLGNVCILKCSLYYATVVITVFY